MSVRARGRSRGEGFTLVELLLSMALTGLVMAMAVPVLHLQKRLWERQEAGREACRALDGALAWVTRDLLQAGYHAPGAPVVRVEDGALAYVLSRDEEDPSAFAAANRRLVTVYLDEGDLKYRIQAPLPPPQSGWETGSTQVLAPGVGAMSCRGLDAAGGPAESPGRVALVACELSGAAGCTAGTAVRLRNAPGGGP